MGTLPREHLATGHDTYDFTKVDALLDAIASRGHQAVIRFTLDTPVRKTGMPQYLIDAGTDTNTNAPQPNTDPNRWLGNVYYLRTYSDGSLEPLKGREVVSPTPGRWDMGGRQQRTILKEPAHTLLIAEPQHAPQ